MTSRERRPGTTGITIGRGRGGFANALGRVGRAAVVSAVVWLGAGAVALACPICFHVEQGPVTDGVRVAVLVLIGVTLAVLSGFGVFIIRFVGRTRQDLIHDLERDLARGLTPGLTPKRPELWKTGTTP